jgi:hypothetical protein
MYLVRGGAHLQHIDYFPLTGIIRLPAVPTVDLDITLLMTSEFWTICRRNILFTTIGDCYSGTLTRTRTDQCLDSCKSGELCVFNRRAFSDAALTC